MLKCVNIKCFLISGYFSFSSDRDECFERIHQCEIPSNFGRCTNTPGSYTCSCENGFQGNGVPLGVTLRNQNGTSCVGKNVENWGMSLCALKRCSILTPPNPHHLSLSLSVSLSLSLSLYLSIYLSLFLFLSLSLSLSISLSLFSHCPLRLNNDIIIIMSLPAGPWLSSFTYSNFTGPFLSHTIPGTQSTSPFLSHTTPGTQSTSFQSTHISPTLKISH